MYIVYNASLEIVLSSYLFYFNFGITSTLFHNNETIKSFKLGSAFFLSPPTTLNGASTLDVQILFEDCCENFFSNLKKKGKRAPRSAFSHAAEVTVGSYS